MKAVPRIALILLGAFSALGIAEISLRFFDDELPVRSEWPTVETQLKASQLNQEDKWDVVFLGSSVTEAAVDPRLITGVDAYNGALPFSTPISHEVWYRGQFSSQEGRVVVLGLPAWPYHLRNDEDRLVSGIESAFDDEAPAALLLATIVHRGVLADWFGLQSRETALQSDFWTAQGHVTAYYEMSEAPITGSFDPFGPPEMSADVRDAIARLAEQVELQKGTFVLMVEPAPFPGEVTDEMLRSYLGTVQALADELNVELWDTFSIGWADNMYADGTHFNRKGTEAFSKLVSDLLSGVR
jgi:hypothetical protein